MNYFKKKWQNLRKKYKNVVHPPTINEQLREYQRILAKSVREIQKEKNTLQSQEKKFLQQIKINAKSGHENSAKILAKNVVRIRKNIDKFYTMEAELSSVSSKLTSMKTISQMTDIMKGVTKTMHSMNKTTNLPAMQSVMRNFEKEAEVLNLKDEIFSDTMEDVMGGENEDEESEELVEKIFDELNISLTTNLKSAPNKTPNKLQEEEEEKKHQELVSRLQELKK